MPQILQFFRQFNWIDIIIFMVLIRILFMGLKHGIVSELLQLTGTLAGLYLGMHYFSGLSDYLRQHPGLKLVPRDMLSLLVFLTLVMMGYSILVGLRLALHKFLTVQVVPGVSRWGGCAASFLRGILACSLLVYALFIPQSHYLRASCRSALCGSVLLETGPRIYGWIWNGLAGRLMTGERFNRYAGDLLKTKPGAAR